MKFDGHVKLTNKAIALVKQNCLFSSAACNMPIFDEKSRVWINDKKTSNTTDNYTAAIVNYLIQFDVFSTTKLADAVALIDLNERWTHDDPKGQKYHFMKATGENNQVAYHNAANFIFTHTFNWVDNARKAIKEESLKAQQNSSAQYSLSNASPTLNHYFISELALALHSLQDSFSPAHTSRHTGLQRGSYEGKYKPLNKGHSNIPQPIRRMHDYSKQNTNLHSKKDYHTGGIDSYWGNMAVNASAELMLMSIDSIWKDDQGLAGWATFQSKWLTYNFS